MIFMKAKDFYDLMCNKLNYRFFSGMPFKEVKFLFLGMSPDFMHYVPATKPDSALGMAYGVRAAGFKSCVILDRECVDGLSFGFPLPIIIITNEPSNNVSDNFYLKDDSISLEAFVTRSEKGKTPVTISIGDGS